jgi:hypothetical protein
MSNASPKSVDSWLELECPRCRASLRIKSAYAHMRGRCPNCGKAIEAPRPAPPPAPVSFDSDEPLGLVPIEEEWPEPAQMVTDERQHYDFGELPSQWAEPKAEKSPDVEGYGFGMGPTGPSPPTITELYSKPYSKEVPGVQPVPEPMPTPPSSHAYQVDLPVDTPPAPSAAPVEEQKKEPERIPPPPPLPPAFPLWSGVYTFPWRLENLRVFLTLALPLGAFAYLAAAFYLLVFVVKILDSEGLNPVAAFVVLLIPPMVIAGLLAALYAAAHFLAIVEDTAAGNDHYQQLGVVADWVGSLLQLAYIGFCTFLPSVALAAGGATILQSPWGLLAGVVLALVLFPTFLLSSMAGVSSMAILNGNVIGGFLRKPFLFPVLFLASAAIAAVCLGLGYLVFVTFSFLLAFAAGFAWAAGLMIYARLLGRVAWVLSQSGVKVKKRRRTRRKKPLSPDDWGGQD